MKAINGFLVFSRLMGVSVQKALLQVLNIITTDIVVPNTENIALGLGFVLG